MPIKVLSLDWDFFIKATMSERVGMFPDGGNETLPEELKKFVWDTLYRNPNLKKIKVTEDYAPVKSRCTKYRGSFFIADSHRHIYDVIMDKFEKDEPLELYNVDFHHDLYHFRTKEGRVNCGNWGNILLEDRPKTKIVWVKHEDSDTTTIGNVEIDVTTWGIDTFLSTFPDFNEFDLIYLCRSSVWSPPHLDNKFVSMISSLVYECVGKCEKGINIPRSYSTLDLPKILKTSK